MVAIRSVTHTWVCKTKGPLYISMFKPLGMIIASAMGVSLLGDTLYLGRYEQIKSFSKQKKKTWVKISIAWTRVSVLLIFFQDTNICNLIQFVGVQCDWRSHNSYWVLCCHMGESPGREGGPRKWKFQLRVFLS